MTYQPAISGKPFPGLRSFQKHESDIFFGRDDHVDEMIAKLAATHFLCVTGPSGCGKSSLARTGLLNGLDAGFMPGTGSNWIFCDFRPGGAALGNLFGALADAVTGGADSEEASATSAMSQEVAEYIENHVNNRSVDLNDALDALSGYAGESILILVDQFEELFRYSQATQGSAAKFVDILLRSSGGRKNIYVVITIRTDELEKCARYAGLTQAINDGQYLTPTLDRFQVQQAIEGPLALFGGAIASDLSIWLLNSLDDELDKLPLMQHALQHLYERKLSERASDEQPANITITLDDFRAAFGIDPDLDFTASESRNALRQSLSTRLDQIYADVPEHLKRGVRRIFCALTSIESRGRDIRKVVPLSRLAEIVGQTRDETEEMLSNFAAEPDYQTGSLGTGHGGYVRISAGPDPQVDVTHECVLRLWTRLQKDWLVDEQRAADSIQDLARRALQYEDSVRGAGWFHGLFRADVLTGHALDRYDTWFADENPSDEWISQYVESAPQPARGAFDSDPASSTHNMLERIQSLLRASKRRRVSQFALAATGVLSVVAAVGIVVWIEFRAEERIASERLEVAVTSLNASDIDALADPVARIEESIRTLGTVLKAGEVTELRNAAFASSWISLTRAHELYRFSHGLPAPSEVHAADFSHDGRFAYSITSEGVFHRWALSETGTPPKTIEMARDGARRAGRSLKVSPAGDVAVIGFEDGTVAVVDLGDFEWRELTHADGRKAHSDGVMDLDFSDAGDVLVTSSIAGELVIWTPAGSGAGDTIDYGSRLSGKLIDWKTIYTKVRQWRDEDRIKERNHSRFGIHSLDIEPEGQHLAFGLKNGRICLLDLKLLKENNDTVDVPRNPRCDTQSAHNPDKIVKTLRFQPERRVLISGGNDDQIMVWNLEQIAKGHALRARSTGVILHHDSDIWDAEFGFGGTVLASISWDGAIRIFDSHTWRQLGRFAGHRSAPRTLRFDPASLKLLTSSLDGTARVWTPFSNRANDRARSHVFPPTPADEPQRELLSTSFGPGGDWLAFNERARVWIKERGKPELDISASTAVEAPPNEAFTHVIAHPQRRIIYAGMTLPELVAWARTGDGTWTAHRFPLPGETAWEEHRPLAISPSGNLLAVAMKGVEASAIVLCKLKDGLPLETCANSSHSQAGQIPYRAADSVGCPKKNPIVPTRLVFTQDGRRLIAGGTDCALHIYDTATGEEVRDPLVGHDDIIFGLDVSADGRLIASSSKASNSEQWPIRIWTLKSGEYELLKGHRSSVTGVRFLPDATHLVSVSYDEDIRVWNVPDRTSLVTLSWHTTNIVGLDIAEASEGFYFATSTDGGKVSVSFLFRSPEQIYRFAVGLLSDKIGVRISE